MPLFDITINVIFFMLIMMGCVILGFLGRSRQLYKKNRRIAELEKQMLDLDAEILEVQKEYTELDARMKNLASPVISMRQASKNESPEKNTKPGGDGGKHRSDRSA